MKHLTALLFVMVAIATKEIPVQTAPTTVCPVDVQASYKPLGSK